MLEVIQILEGGFDCRTGTRLGKGVVLSNGVEEVNLQLDDGQMEAVVGLFAQALARRGINPHDKPVSEFAGQPQVVRDLGDQGDGEPIHIVIPPAPSSEDPDFPEVTHGRGALDEGGGFHFSDDEHSLAPADVAPTPAPAPIPPAEKADEVGFEPLAGTTPLAVVAGDDRDGEVAEDGLASL